MKTMKFVTVSFGLSIALCAIGGCAADGPQGPGRGDTGTNRDSGRPDTGRADVDEDTATPDVIDDVDPGDTDPGDTDPGDTDPGDTDPGDTGSDTTPTDTGTDTTQDAGVDITEICGEVYASASNRTLPVDIIWMVDNSTSMEDQTSQVESNLNNFANFIGSSGLDYEVVMLSRSVDEVDPIFGITSYLSVCVPPPLSGSPGCPDTDSERYDHIPQTVDSNNALEIFTRAYPVFGPALRTDSIVHVIVVTDDESNVSASEFTNQLPNLSPPMSLSDIRFHSIVGMNDSCAVAPGNVYQDLSNQTGGVIFSSCASDWSGVFDEIADAVVEGSVLPCEYDIPEVSSDFQLNPDEVNAYEVSEGGDRTLIPAVDEVSECGSGGWYYDDFDNPTRVILCPESCGEVDGEVELEFGCTRIKQ